MAGTSHASSMNRLVALLSRLPGIGKRSAERVAFHLLKQPGEEVTQLAQAIIDLKRNTKQCSICFNVAEADPCPICCDERRDRGLVLVVEQPNDLVSIEQTGMFKGVYHVLMGRIAPLDGIGPGDLTVDELLERVVRGQKSEVRGQKPEVRSQKSEVGNQNPSQDAALKAANLEPATQNSELRTHNAEPRTQNSSAPPIHEIIIGTNPTLEGDGTALYLQRELAKLGVKVTRLARGLPHGSHMALVSKAVLADALMGRGVV